MSLDLATWAMGSNAEWPDAIGAERGFNSMDRGGDEDGGDLVEVEGKGAECAFCSLRQRHCHGFP